MTDSEHPSPIKNLTRAQSRAVDRAAIETLGIPGVVLMENAGVNAADIAAGMVQAKVGDGGHGNIAIVCGGGNNGGDGFVMARHLSIAGHRVALFTTVDPDALSGDAAINAKICQRLGLAMFAIEDAAQLAEHAKAWGEADVLVDALLGTGFAGDTVRPHTAAVIEAMNQAGGDAGPLVLAVDVPSGLDCDSGQPASACVRADATVTFVARKVGFEQPAAREVLGEVFVASIGVPQGIVNAVLGAS